MLPRAGLILTWSFLMLFSTSLSTPTSASHALPAKYVAVELTTNPLTSVADGHVSQAYPTTNGGAATGAIDRAMAATTSKVFLPFMSVAPTSLGQPAPAVTRTATAAPTATKVPPTATPSSTGNVRVLCDGKIYDGYTTPPFVLQTTVDRDPTVQKVIRNCTFRNSTLAAITIRDAKNVLIEGNTFQNIRTHVAGQDVHAINVPCMDGCNINNITIRNNNFSAIGADGIQLGANNRMIYTVHIEGNTFVGGADVGENAVDVKGVEGPISITGNTVHGFRPCDSPKRGGTQDCSGSNGEGIVIHSGGTVQTPAYNVTLQNNDLYDNTEGLSIIAGVRNIVAQANRIHNNVALGILVSGAYSVVVTQNTLSYNPTHISVSSTPLSGGSCQITNNTFVGGGTPMSGGCK